MVQNQKPTEPINTKPTLIAVLLAFIVFTSRYFEVICISFITAYEIVIQRDSEYISHTGQLTDMPEISIVSDKN